MIWYIISEAFFDKTYIDDTFGPKPLVIRTGSNPLKAKSDIFAKKRYFDFINRFLIKPQFGLKK